MEKIFFYEFSKKFNEILKIFENRESEENFLREIVETLYNALDGHYPILMIKYEKEKKKFSSIFLDYKKSEKIQKFGNTYILYIINKGEFIYYSKTDFTKIFFLGEKKIENFQNSEKNIFSPKSKYVKKVHKPFKIRN